MKRLLNDRRILYYMLSIMIILVFTLTIAYAALNTVLKITGNAEVVASSWDIYLDNVQLVSGSATTNVPTITDKTTASFYTTLKNPGDYYMFTIDVVNNGSIDAMIDSVEKLPELSSVQAKYLNYIVEYQNGESINTKQLVEKNSFVRLKVKVEFRKDLVASDLPSTAETLNLSFKVNYIQADEDGTSSITNSGKLVKVVSGNYDTVGSEVCIDSECFYVISSTQNDVTMFSKYNLYAGNECAEGMSSTCVPYGNEATGIQNETMLAFYETGKVRRGTIGFANDNYWHDTALKEEYGTMYPVYVYDSNSLLYPHVENYKNYLEHLGVNINEARLISYPELVSLGCDASTNLCSDTYPFVLTTSYWAGFASNEARVWRVDSVNFFGGADVLRDYTFGIRPVIEISKEYF